MSTVHVMIQDPSTSRSEILNAALNAADFLKNYEDLTALEERKKFYRMKIKKTLEKIRVLHSKVLTSLPKLDNEYSQDEKVVTNDSDMAKTEEPIEKSESIKTKTSLSREMDDIRKKLSGLKIKKI
jgi:hypothetical protein